MGTNPAVVVVRPAEPHCPVAFRIPSLAEEHGSTVTLDGDFARDLEARHQ